MKSNTVKIIISMQMGFNIIAAIVILILAILSVYKRVHTTNVATTTASTTAAKPLNGNWGNWTNSTSCTQTCGNGTLAQTRVCNNPAPANGGASCAGSPNQTLACNTFLCPVNGNWGAWSNSSSCTKTCGNGTMSQIRVCNNPAPAIGGSNCTGPSSQTIDCNTNPCPVFSKVLVALGSNGQNLADVEIVDLLSPNTTCQKPATFPYPNDIPLGELGLKEKPYICSGVTNRLSCRYYEGGAWMISPYNLNMGRVCSSMVKFPFQNGSRLFISGGYEPMVNSTEVLTENGWQFSVPLPVTIHFHCLAIFNSTSVIAIGGYHNGLRSGNTFILNFDINIWTAGPKLIKPRDSFSCGSINRNNQTQEKSVIAVGGYDGSFIATPEVLDLGSTTWRTLSDAPFGTARTALVQDPSGGVVVIGGGTFTVLTNTLYWLPHAGPGAAWVKMPQKLTIARWGHTAFLIPDEIANCK